MARREVSVTLDLQARKFLDSDAQVLASAKATKHEIKDLGDKADAAARDIDGLGDQAKQSAAEMLALAAAAEAAKRGVGGFDDEATKARATTARIHEDIRLLEEELKRLAQEYEQTGTAAAKAALLGADRQQSELNRLRALRRELAGLAKAGGAGGGILVTSSIVSAPNFMPDQLKPALIAVLVGSVAAAAPAIGGMIGGVVAAAVGTIGIAGGILAAQSDPKVKAAEHLFAFQFGQVMKSAAAPISEPFLAALGKLGAKVQTMGLDTTFKTAAPYIGTFETGIENLIDRFMPQFNHAMEEAGPVMGELADDLGDFGSSLGYFFNKIGDGKGNVEGLRILFGLLDGTLIAVANTVNFLSNTLYGLTRGLNIVAIGGMQAFPPFKLLAQVTDALSSSGQRASRVVHGLNGHFSELTSTTNGISTTITGAAHSFSALVISTAAATKATNDLKQATQDYINLQLGLKNSTLAIKQDMFNLTEEFKKGKFTLSDFTQTGLDHQAMLAGLINDYERQRQANAASSMGIDKANALFREQIKTLEILAIKHGADAKAVKQIADSLLALPQRVPIFIEIHGLNALHTLQAAASWAANLIGSTSKEPAAPKHHAAGGLIGMGQVGWTGEFGPELVRATPMGALVTNHAASVAAMGGGTPVVNVAVRVDPIDGRVRDVQITDARGRGIPEADIRIAHP